MKLTGDSNGLELVGKVTAPTPEKNGDDNAVATVKYVKENGGRGGCLWEVADDGSGIVPTDPLDLTPDDVGTDADTIRNIIGANYLSKDGGALTGNVITRSDSNSYLQLRGGADAALLNLYGKGHTSNGGFLLGAYNGTATRSLFGDTSGNLTWGSKPIKSMAFPSATKVAISVSPASTSEGKLATYTAPANGYVYLSVSSGSSSDYIALGHANGAMGTNIRGSGTGTMSCFLPVKKGIAVNIQYRAVSVLHCDFIYAEGEV